MARIIPFDWFAPAAVLLAASVGSACVSTEALYAEYDAADCHFVAVENDSGEVLLLEHITQTHFPWEPAVYFDFDSNELTESERTRLRKSMRVLTEFESMSVGLQGFADSIGGLDYNKALAERRVGAVQAFLLANGIAERRISRQPIGEVLPEIGNDADRARATNRRVELSLLHADGKLVVVDVVLNSE